MTKGDMIRNYSDTVLAEWLTVIEKRAIEYQNIVNSLSYNDIKNDWIKFLKEEENENNP